LSDATSPHRKIFTRISIPAGNALQIGGILAASCLLRSARSQHGTALSTVFVIFAWVLLYFSCHAIAHWLVGSLVGIRFRFYTIGGTGNPAGWPGPLRWIFEHLPFFGVQTEKASMQNTSPRGKALMWSAGVTSSAIVPTLAAIWAWKSRVPGSTLFLVFALFWSVGTVSSNWRSATGDYAKARRALGRV
jgi:hypothetical protein